MPNFLAVIRALNVAMLVAIFVSGCGSTTPELAAAEPPPSTALLDDQAKLWWQPRADEQLRWYWQLQGPIVTSLDVDVYDIDIDTPQPVINQLKARGVKLICYFSVGTVEWFRDDADQFPSLIVGDRYDGYPDEQWLDISNIDALASIMRARMDRCAEKGFDGIEGDNVDAFLQEKRNTDNVITQRGTSFAITQQQGADYVLWLAEESHLRGLGFGLKNAESLATAVTDQVDWMITENCFVDNWCDTASQIRAANKPVFMTEYVELLSDFKPACVSAIALGFNAIYRDRELSATGRFEECL